MKIEFSGLKREHSEIGELVLTSLGRVLESGRYILGENVRQFEVELASYLGVKYAVGVASGTEAIALALWAYDIGAGDEVITTDVTAFPTVNAIMMTGATPVFVDVDSTTGLMDLDKLEESVTRTTKAIVPVHLYGQCVDMVRLTKFASNHHLVVVEDCAQAFGSRQNGRPAGVFGDVAAFSFYPTKNLGAVGDGGAVVTNRDELHERLLKLRNHGQVDRYHHESFGINSRLDELQASVLRVKLPFVNRWNDRRSEIAGYYRAGLKSEVATPLRVNDGNAPNYHLFVVRTQNRDMFQSELRKEGIDCLIHYPTPCSQQRALGEFVRGPNVVWASDTFTREVISLPLYPQLTDTEVEYIISTVNKYGNQ